jgi:hypothetical protein
LIAACRECLTAQEGYRDVVTLNHDTLLERTFRENGIEVEDGFGDDRDAPVGVPVWVGYALEKPVPRVRLVKLHGSIDWWTIAPPEKGSDIVARVEEPFRLVDHTGTLWDTPDARPRMLIGTTNKMLDYVRPLNIDRLAVFRRSLLRCHGVVVSGYSFRDKGVNGLLADWCWRRSGQLVVVAPGVTSAAPPDTARGAIRRAWAHMFSNGRLLALDATFAESEWGSIRAFLRDGTTPRP